jgi:hypothetical protein
MRRCYFDPRPFVEKLIPLVAMTGQSLPMDQLLVETGANRRDNLRF